MIADVYHLSPFFIPRQSVAPHGPGSAAMKTSRILATLLLAGATAAQDPLIPPPTRGMLSAIQIGVVFDHNLNQICRKGPGLPAPLYDFKGISGPTLPEFTTEALEIWIAAQPLGAGGQQFSGGVLLDAMTSGNDFLPLVYNSDVNGQGVAAFQILQGTTEDWAALFFSIETATKNNGGTIYGYYFKNPGFPLKYQNAVYTEINVSEYSTGTVTAPPGNANIAALDSAMGMMASSQGEFEPSIIESQDSMCFSLTPACAVALWNTKIPNLVGSRPEFTGGTIFEAKYGTNGQVVDILVIKEHTELGLSEDDDIDALAISEVKPLGFQVMPPLSEIDSATRQYVFSLDDASSTAYEQLMVHASVSGSGPTTDKLRTESGNPLVGPAGTLAGDVKGACGKDPEVQMFSETLGIPANSLITAPEMSLSLHAVDSLLPPPFPSPYPYGADSVDLTGVLSGWGTSQPHDAMVFVGIVHPLGTIVRQLPMRSSQQDVYDFTENFLVPYPNPAGWHYYHVIVGTLGTSAGHQNVLLESTGSLLVRRP